MIIIRWFAYGGGWVYQLFIYFFISADMANI